MLNKILKNSFASSASTIFPRERTLSYLGQAEFLWDFWWSLSSFIVFLTCHTHYNTSFHFCAFPPGVSHDMRVTEQNSHTKNSACLLIIVCPVCTLWLLWSISYWKYITKYIPSHFFNSNNQGQFQYQLLLRIHLKIAKL